MGQERPDADVFEHGIALEQVAKIYGFTDKHKAKRIIGAPRVSGEHRVMLYYLGDVATDIVKRRIGIVR